MIYFIFLAYDLQELEAYAAEIVLRFPVSNWLRENPGYLSGLRSFPSRNIISVRFAVYLIFMWVFRGGFNLFFELIYWLTRRIGNAGYRGGLTCEDGDLLVEKYGTDVLRFKPTPIPFFEQCYRFFYLGKQVFNDVLNDD